MKINNIRFTKLALVCLSFINCTLLFAGKNELPGFKGLNKSKELHLSNWISLKHCGPEDRPVEEFVIAFSTKTVSTVNTERGVTVLALPLIEMQQILDFIKTKGNSTDTEIFSLGVYRSRVYFQSIVKQTFFMDNNQSLLFFNYIDSILYQRTELNIKAKHSFDRTIDFLTGLQKNKKVVTSPAQK